MRMMLRFSMEVEKSSRAFNDGTLASTFETMLTRLKPEAAYFCPVDGKRGGMIVFDMTDPSQIPVVVEPLFHRLGAAVEIFPVTNKDDLQRGIAAAKAA